MESEVPLLTYLFLGDVFDRASVVFMIVQGELDENAAKELAPGTEKMLLNAKYYALGEFIKSYFIILLFTTADSSKVCFLFY